VSLGSRGLRDMDGGPEPIVDEAEKAQVRRQVMRVHVKSLLTAAAVTGFVLAARW
jgi:hypothetical protein